MAKALMIAAVLAQAVAVMYVWRLALRERRAGQRRTAGWVVLAVAVTGGLVLRLSGVLDYPYEMSIGRIVSLLNSFLLLLAAYLLNRHMMAIERARQEAADVVTAQLAARGVVIDPGVCNDDGAA